MPVTCVTFSQGKRTNLRKTGSERIGHGMRVKFNPLALLLDSSLEGEFDLVQRIIYEVQMLTCKRGSSNPGSNWEVTALLGWGIGHKSG